MLLKGSKIYRPDYRPLVFPISNFSPNRERDDVFFIKYVTTFGETTCVKIDDQIKKLKRLLLTRDGGNVRNQINNKIIWTELPEEYKEDDVEFNETSSSLYSSGNLVHIILLLIWLRTFPPSLICPKAFFHFLSPFVCV
jgi:hypothetical protein